MASNHHSSRKQEPSKKEDTAKEKAMSRTAASSICRRTAQEKLDLHDSTVSEVVTAHQRLGEVLSGLPSDAPCAL